MGGCKCSYRNCTSKSNGQIHLFHYPVFDRPRCNKWLINAHRQEFLNLKVSQLKNRVICQYHFKDEDFMNSIKDKLKPSAVPTLNGPNCDPSEWGGGEADEVVNDIYLDDIENDLYLNYDKKDCVSRKYGNFLSDSDFIDLDFISYKKPSVTNINTKNQSETNLSFKKPSTTNNNPSMTNLSNKESLITNVNNKKPSMNSYKKSPIKILNHKRPASPKIEKLISILRNPVNDNQTQNTGKRQLNLEEMMCTPQNQLSHYSNSVRISKIEIISDEKVSDALKAVTTLEPVKRDSVLPLPKRIRNSRQNTSEVQNNSQHLIKEEVGTNEIFFSGDTKHIIQNVEHNNIQPTLDVQPLSYEIPVITPIDLPVLDLGQNFEEEKSIEMQDNEIKEISNKDQLRNIDQEKIMNIDKIGLPSKKNRVTKATPKTSEKVVSILKNKMCSKRLSAIQQKRDFNKKLTDIISKQILNDEEKRKEQHSQTLSPAEVKTSKANSLQNEVKAHLSEDSSLLTTNEYSIATLECRMKKMERMLLQKMEDNTKMVLKLKKSFDNKPTSFRAVTTQTGIDEESHKKYLYHEISKYLSPEANNFIFEELFINKFEPKRKLRR